jgi:hypothetical protein
MLINPVKMKLSKIYVISILLLIVSILSNCTVQKRSYQKGYYISWNKKAVPTSKVTKHFEAKKAEPEIVSTKLLYSKTYKTDEPLFVSAQKINKLGVRNLTTKRFKIVNDSCGDIIMLKDGTEIEGKVIEVGSRVIRYKRCNNLGGPLIVVNTEKVFMIKYADGTKEVLKKTVEINENPNVNIVQQQPKQIVKKKYNSMAIASIATFILYFTIIFAPLPFIFGLIALNQFKRNPEEYKGKWMAIVGVVPGFIIIFSIIIVLLLFLI